MRIAVPLTAAALALVTLTASVRAFPDPIPTADPFANATLIDTVTSDDIDFFLPIDGASPPPTPTYLAASASLTTNVYRTAGGTLGFAYTINSLQNPRPFNPPPFPAFAVPRLSLPGFTNFAATVSGDPIAGATSTRVGDDLLFNFGSGDPSLAGIPSFYSLHFGTPATLFVETDATSYQSSDVQLFLRLYDGRDSTTGFGTPHDVTSFLPADAATAPVPEPLTIALLPLAIGALALKHRRHTTSR